MGVTQWTRLTLDRFGSSVRLLLERDEDDLPMEEDPIGEFLSLKERGGHLPDDEEYPMEDASVAEEVCTDDADAEEEEAEEAEPVVVNLLDDPEEDLAVVEELSAVEGDVLTSADESEEEEMVGVADDSISPDNVPEPEAGVETVADKQPEVSQADMAEDPAATASSESEAETVQSSLAQSGLTLSGLELGDDDKDSLMDVFLDEQVSDSPISLLARDLEETDVYSLLEEMKRIANMLKESTVEGS